jgi:hypothetical protein
LVVPLFERILFTSNRVGKGEHQILGHHTPFLPGPLGATTSLAIRDHR